MPERELAAHSVTSGDPVRLCWRDGIIASIEPVDDAPKDLWLAPPLIDLQINGYAGIDFQQDDVTCEDLLHAVSKIQAAGCTRFLLTLISDHWPVMMQRLA